MKPLLIPILIAELFIAYFFLAPTCIHRPETARSFAAWQQNPTPETRVEYDKQRRITNLESLGFSAICFTLMAGITIFAFRKLTPRIDRQPASL